MMTSLIRFSKADDGASLIEYSLLIGMISAAIIASITAISGSMAAIWSTAQSVMATAA